MQHRAWLAAQKIPVVPLIYYFGSRHRSQEYLYGEEIEAYIQDNVITHAGLAFSRDSKHKVYIQHKMRDDADTLARHLTQDKGVFYLCGPTWPVPDVYETLVGALVRHHGKTEEEAGEYLEGLKEEERYVLEVRGTVLCDGSELTDYFLRRYIKGWPIGVVSEIGIGR